MSVSISMFAADEIKIMMAKRTPSAEKMEKLKMLKKKKKKKTCILLAFLTQHAVTTQSRPQRKPLRKHAYSNTLYIENFTTKNSKFSDKNSDIFHISAQNIDCGYSLEPPR